MVQPYDVEFRGDTAAGFATSATLFRELLQHDRETTALVSVLSSRMTSLSEDVEHLVRLVERGNGREPLLLQVVALRRDVQALQSWRESREPWAAVLERVQGELAALQRGELSPEAQAEHTKGKWTILATAIGVAGSIALGLINLLK